MSSAGMCSASPLPMAGLPGGGVPCVLTSRSNSPRIVVWPERNFPPAASHRGMVIFAGSLSSGSPTTPEGSSIGIFSSVLIVEGEVFPAVPIQVVLQLQVLLDVLPQAVNQARHLPAGSVKMLL